MQKQRKFALYRRSLCGLPIFYEGWLRRIAIQFHERNEIINAMLCVRVQWLLLSMVNISQQINNSARRIINLFASNVLHKKCYLTPNFLAAELPSNLYITYKTSKPKAHDVINDIVRFGFWGYISDIFNTELQTPANCHWYWCTCNFVAAELPSCLYITYKALKPKAHDVITMSLRNDIVSFWVLSFEAI